MSTRNSLDRKRRLLKRDYNRDMDEISKLMKAPLTADDAEQLFTLHVSIIETKNELKAMFMDYLDLLDPNDENDKKFEEELLSERDAYLLECNRLTSTCNKVRKKLETQQKRESMNFSTVSNQNVSTGSSAKLPKINVPTFDGNLRKFLDFKALFENLVHNDNDIPFARKMHYLNLSLVGSASSTLTGIPLSEEGYTEAWNRLLQKYDNKRLIIHTHFNDLFSTEKAKSEFNLRSMLDQIDLALRGLRACGETTDNWSTILAHILYIRLDSKTRSDFDNTITDQSSYYNFTQLFKFCESRANNVEARKLEDNFVSPKATALVPKFSTQQKAYSDPRKTFLTTKAPCVVCRAHHLLIDCAKFKSKTPSERYEVIRDNKLCCNCFSSSHMTSNCQSPKSCKICRLKHHSLLHLPEPQKIQPSVIAPTQKSETAPKFSSNVSILRSPIPSRSFVILPSAVVRFVCGSVTGLARILLDNCSQPTLITDDFVRHRRLLTYKNTDGAPIRGVGQVDIATPRTCLIKLFSRINSFEIDVQADVIPASAIPYSVNSLSWDEAYNLVQNFDLADPAFYNKHPNVPQIDILLGAQYVEKCLMNETMAIKDLTMRRTQFGWSLSGSVPSAYQSTSSISAERYCHLTTVNIADQLARFWEVEEVSASKEKTSDADFCESHFLNNTTRATNGQFIVRLPFTSPPTNCHPNRNKALAILHRSESNQKSDDLRTKYAEFLTEYEALGHMSKVERSNSGYFIPHHAVLRPTSSTTKLRVVFNASSKTSSGHSLNDLLAVGPQIQPDLFDHLVRYRDYAVVIKGDVGKMYRCVLVHPDDRKYQKILWRSRSNEMVADYQLNTVTYGTAPASFLAVRCLFALADSISGSDPIAAQAIKYHFYMDDLLTGAESAEAATSLYQRIHSTLESAGFILRKYQSNSEEVLSGIDPELVETTPSYTFGDAWATSLLGVAWNPCADVLRINATPSSLQNSNTCTKRQLLSEIAKVFDPLGISAPLTVRGKLFIRQVWQEEIQWDSNVSPNLWAEARNYLSELPTLSSLALPRAYTSSLQDTQETVKLRQLIGFCDASERAYCAVVYLRCVVNNTSISTSFIAAKTRIAPVKSLTIPKLELQAAVLLTELVSRIMMILQIDRSNVYLFSDSEVTLAWIAKPSHNWNVFVKNRVQKIASTFPSDHWAHVTSNLNPADLATRGISATALINSVLWFQGPEFLLNFDCFRYLSGSNHIETSCEVSEVSGTPTNACLQTVCVGTPFINRFSKYHRLLAVLGRVIMFVRRWKMTRSAGVKYSKSLSLNECYIRARIAVICNLQVEAFGNVIGALQKNLAVPSKSGLRNLDPFIDEEGILRVGGRMQNSPYSYHKKHPIIIPKKCHFMRLYVIHLHEKFCHATKAFIVTFVQAEYWVCGGLSQLVKSVVQACVTCARYRGEGFKQVMGQLPAVRVTPSRPFSNTGIDFCGPFSARCVGHRSVKFNKIYAAIFVCLCTRAVHIEIVSSLTSTGFMMSLHRFVARRGLPSSLYSDCGTNFVGSSNYLDLKDESIQFYAASEKIQWIFNPPSSPHRGGIWEAAVKSAKSHLVRVTNGQTLNYEEYTTLFSRIEAILNSRPIAYRNQPERENFVLTPSHFLIGSLPYIIPEPEVSRLPLYKRYNLIRTMVDSFWKHWVNDFLTTLQKKEKWQTKQVNVEVGQVVLLKGASSPCAWPLAVVESVVPDKFGRVRTVTVRHNNKVSPRDIRSLVYLPLEQ